LKPLSTSRGQGHAWVSDVDTDLVSEWALIPDEGGEADACTTTADGFRATVIALRSLDGNKGLSLRTFCLLDDGCVRLLIKNLDRKMHKVVVREKLKTRFLSKKYSCAPGSVTGNPPRPAP
jgi:hypothetical protein